MLNEQNIEKILIFLQSNFIPHKENHLLKYDTYFKTGGVARIYIEPNSKSKFIDLIGRLTNDGLPYKIIGSTSNIYLLDELKYSIIISTKSLRQLSINNNILEVEAGYQLEDLVRVALINNASGFEGLEGIPGSIGGGIFMNAGAYGYCISDNLISVTVLNNLAEVLEMTKDECKFTHRFSTFKENSNYIILSAKFHLVAGDQNSIANKIRTFHIARHSYQEFSYPNLGSLFSVKGDFYREFFRNDTKYKTYCFLLKVLLRNPFSKFLLRKNPNNKLFNRLLIKYINSSKIYLPVSDKSFNILINDGSSNFIQKYNHINELKKYLKNSTPIENEFVFEPLMDEQINKDFYQKYQEVIKL
jgi:UDP-N-acetylmuramate dehydrogenase